MLIEFSRILADTQRKLGTTELLHLQHQDAHRCTDSCESLNALRDWRRHLEDEYAKVVCVAKTNPSGNLAEMQQHIVDGLRGWPVAQQDPRGFFAVVLRALKPRELALLESFGDRLPQTMGTWVAETLRNGGAVYNAQDVGWSLPMTKMNDEAR